ncbi:hypothetical protein STFR1_30024 [Bacillus vallismortis]
MIQKFETITAFGTYCNKKAMIDAYLAFLFDAVHAVKGG